MKNISVIGAGYVGLVTAACFAELGHKVNLLEIDNARLSDLEQGEMPISEPGLPELWERNKAEGRISVTDNYIMVYWELNLFLLPLVHHQPVMENPIYSMYVWRQKASPKHPVDH